MKDECSPRVFSAYRINLGSDVLCVVLGVSRRRLLALGIAYQSVEL